MIGVSLTKKINRMNEFFKSIDKGGTTELLSIIAIAYSVFITILFLSVFKENVRLNKKKKATLERGN